MLLRMTRSCIKEACCLILPACHDQGEVPILRCRTSNTTTTVGEYQRVPDLYQVLIAPVRVDLDLVM